MPNDTTVIYYSSNREDPVFEERIIGTLLASSHPLPIVSVTQKPVALGKNICVGDVGVSMRNAWRQLQIGCKEAKTRYVCTAESDMIFPKEYFQFIPPRDDTFYTARQVYVLFAQNRGRKMFGLKPRGTEGAMVVNREYLIDRLERTLGSYPVWGEMETPEEKDTFPYLFNRSDGMRRDNFILPVPVISFKTDQNMHRKTPFHRDHNSGFIDGIGTPMDLIRKYIDGC